MKKIISLFVAILLMGGVAFAQTGTQTGPGVGEIFGKGKRQSDYHRIYREVRYIGTTGSLTAPAIVIWNLTEDDGVTIDTTTTSYDSAVAGIVTTTVVSPDEGNVGNTAAQDHGERNWTWLQTYGYATIDVLSAVSAGHAMGTSTTAGEAGHFVGNTTEANLQGKAGFFYDDADAAAEDVECFVILD